MTDAHRRVWSVHSTAAESVWYQALPLIERALEHDNGRVSAGDLLNDIKAKDKQLWLGAERGTLKIVAITELVMWPQFNVCRFVLLAGEDFDGWWSFARPIFESWAKAEGCRQFEVRGRLGWARKLKGWSLDHVVMRTEV